MDFAINIAAKIFKTETVCRNIKFKAEKENMAFTLSVGTKTILSSQRFAHR